MIDDELFMRKAVEEARNSLAHGEVPVGAVLVSGNHNILSCTHNETIKRNDPTAHAEIMAIREACLKRRNYRLPDCSLYVSLEPCAMCLGAAVHARIKRLVYGAPDPKSGAVESIMKFPLGKTNHLIEIKGGVLAAESGKILSHFFRGRRRKKRQACRQDFSDSTPP